MKIFALCLLVLAASEPCYDCNSQDTDEVQLLQVRSGQKEIPGLDKLVDSVSQAVGAARKIADQGIGQVTTQLTSAMDKAELEISSATQKFNTSIINFHAQAKEADTVAQNFTKLQKLVADTVGNLIPCYTATLENVKGAVAATKTILSSIGQKDVLEKLETCQGTAVEKFTQLADTTSAMGMQIANSASMKVGEALDILRSQTAGSWAVKGFEVAISWKNRDVCWIPSRAINSGTWRRSSRKDQWFDRKSRHSLCPIQCFTQFDQHRIAQMRRNRGYTAGTGEASRLLVPHFWRNLWSMRGVKLTGCQMDRFRSHVSSPSWKLQRHVIATYSII